MASNWLKDQYFQVCQQLQGKHKFHTQSLQMLQMSNTVWNIVKNSDAVGYFIREFLDVKSKGIPDVF